MCSIRWLYVTERNPRVSVARIREGAPESWTLSMAGPPAGPGLTSASLAGRGHLLYASCLQELRLEEGGALLPQDTVPN